MLIRNAEIKDLPSVMEIYQLARKFMKDNGNPTQWENGYPQEEIIRSDIEAGNFYVCEAESRIVGVFTFFIGEEPNYRDIQEGCWHSEETYGVIHRVASDGSVRGFSGKCFTFCREKCRYLRIDTHRDNQPMQNALQRFGFRECGIVRVEDGTERIAFDYEAR